MCLMMISSFKVNAQKISASNTNIHQVKIQTSAICEMCQYLLERELTFDKGVKEASLNLENKVMTLTYNPKKTDENTLRKNISELGYHADSLARNPASYNALPSCCKDGSRGTPIPQLPKK